jgi:CMP-N-acetylneuraminic acid synthetase
MLKQKTQDLPPKFPYTGTFAIISAEELRADPGNSVDQQFLCCAVPRERGIDTDDPEDLNLARFLLRVGLPADREQLGFEPIMPMSVIYAGR